MIKVKRIYDKSEKEDGMRILVDRLWPRGVSKENANIESWVKLFTPSFELRSWYHKNKKENFKEFQEKYKLELKANKKEIEEEVLKFPKNKNLTLITSVKDIEHSHIPALKSFLEKLRK